MLLFCYQSSLQPGRLCQDVTEDMGEHRVQQTDDHQQVSVTWHFIRYRGGGGIFVHQVGTLMYKKLC